MRDRFHWARVLAFVTGFVNQDLLLRNEYLITENRILRGHLPMRLRLWTRLPNGLARIGKLAEPNDHQKQICSASFA